MTSVFTPCEIDLIEHYADPLERAADKWVHLVALALAVVGGFVLCLSSWVAGDIGRTAAVALYAACLISMLAASTAYNLSHVCSARPLLRRLDEAAIFLMIAGSYTPFTTQRFDGGLEVAMTALVWAVALGGVALKLLAPPLNDKVWAAVYASFGWLAVLMIQPMIKGVGPVGVLLIAAGGLIYTAGVLAFINPRLRYRRAIWHGFVAVAAAVHYAAIFAFVAVAAT